MRFISSSPITFNYLVYTFNYFLTFFFLVDLSEDLEAAADKIYFIIVSSQKYFIISVLFKTVSNSSERTSAGTNLKKHII